MKAKDIQDLIDFIAQSGLDEVNIETENLKLNVKRSQSPNVAPVYINPNPAPQLAPSEDAQPVNPASQSLAASPEPSPASSDNHTAIKSPMIGTFYRASDPETPVFVNVGDEVKVGQVVCIIEAMKLFNEIESEVSGRVVKVLVDNASPVEYDQPLFLVEPI